MIARINIISQQTGSQTFGVDLESVSIQNSSLPVILMPLKAPTLLGVFHHNLSVIMI